MKDYTVVLSVFDDEEAADAAAASLRASGLAPHEAIGVLVLDDDGEVKTEKVGAHSTGKGVGIGLALAMLTPVGLGVGIIGGGLVGSLRHKGLGLDQLKRDQLGAALRDGKAAVGVLAQVGGADAVLARLTELGGAAESHALYADDDEAAPGASSSGSLEELRR
jgi:uncharacterized membrane protein